MALRMMAMLMKIQLRNGNDSPQQGGYVHTTILGKESTRGGFSCIEVTAALVGVVGPVLIGIIIGARSGTPIGVASGLMVGVACGLSVGMFYSWSARLRQQEMEELQTLYPRVFRILSVPAELSGVKADGVEITIGDYAWEAEPISRDGLIYLQGLTSDWCVAWYAGFESSQIEQVCQKPRSQYYLPYTWVCAGAVPPACPYSVLHQPVNNLGYPQRIAFPFVQGIRVSRS